MGYMYMYYGKIKGKKGKKIFFYVLLLLQKFTTILLMERVYQMTL